MISIEVDKLKLLRGNPIKIDEKMILLQPTIGQIEEYDESKFMSVFYALCSCAWDRPAAFADIGIDFMDVSDWEYFFQTVQNFSKDDTCLIFGDLDFSKFKPFVYQLNNEDDKKIILANIEPITINGITYDVREYQITEELYNNFIPYVREMIGFTHKGRKAKNKTTAKILIMEDRKEQERNKNKPYTSLFHDGLISLVNTEEFPYTYETAFDITIYQFTKSLMQIQGKKQAVALLQGSMSGFVDTKGIPSKNFQWIYSEDKYNKTSGKTLKQSLAPGEGNKLNIK